MRTYATAKSASAFAEAKARAPSTRFCRRWVAAGCCRIKKWQRLNSVDSFTAKINWPSLNHVFRSNLRATHPSASSDRPSAESRIGFKFPRFDCSESACHLPRRTSSARP